MLVQFPWTVLYFMFNLMQKGMTAVHIASKRENVEALKLLLSYSGDPNVKSQV